MKVSMSTPIGTTKCKTGDMPELLKYLYIMDLKFKGFVAESSVTLAKGTCNSPIKNVFKILAPNGYELNIEIMPEVGFIGGSLFRTKNVQRIYSVGSSEPVEYISGGY